METEVFHTAGIITFRENSVLLVKHGEEAGHHTGVYGIPLGGIDEGESSVEAALRELGEETGLWAEPQRLVKLDHNYPATIDRKDGPRNYEIDVYYAPAVHGNERATAETQPEWVPLTEVKDLDRLPIVDEAIRDTANLRQS